MKSLPSAKVVVLADSDDKNTKGLEALLMNADEKATSEFALRIAVLLALRLALSIITVWCFAWGTVVLILRVAFATPRPFLLWGLAGVLPAAVLAFILARRRIPKHGSVRALLDMHSRCGGLFMAAGDVDIGDWRTRMPVVGAPRLSWHSGRSWALLAAAGLFLLVGFLVPQRLVTTPSAGALEIDEEIDKLADQIEILQEEEILEPEKAEAILEKLEQLRTEASGEDPVKTWEALDHLEGIPKQAAKEAAEAAIRETERLTRAETLAEGLLEEGAAMEPKLMAEAMSALAQMVEKAAEETELCKRRLTRKDLLKACEAGTSVCA